MERILAEFESQKNIDLIITGLDVIDEDDNIVWTSKGSSLKFYNTNFFKQLKNCNYFGCTMAVRRHFLEKALPFPKYIVSHDNWLGLLAKWDKKIFVIGDSLLLYRRHGSNVTNHINNPVLFKIFYRIYYIYAIYKRKHLRK